MSNKRGGGRWGGSAGGGGRQRQGQGGYCTHIRWALAQEETRAVEGSGAAAMEPSQDWKASTRAHVQR